MFKWLIRLFRRPRLIERYECLSDILEAHNALITKTIDVAQDMPPKYLCARYSAIQDAEERAIKAYWRNKTKKHDVWRNPAKKDPKELTQAEIAAKPPLTALDGETSEPQTQLSAAQACESIPAAQDVDKNNVIEIHINK